jgi:prephenate dehydrogenase
VRIALLGLGLVGGSIARALRLDVSGDWHVTAWSPSGRGPATALAEGVIDAAAPDLTVAVAGAELVVLAAPATDCLRLLDDLAGPLAASLTAGAIVTDVASSKGALVERARDLRLRFVGGHPMAGREATGYEAATADLFSGRPWILVPDGTGSEADAAVVASLARACGARPVVMTPEAHDAGVAGISHLPLITAVALVEAVAGGVG